MSLLSVNNLRVCYGQSTVVEGVSFSLDRGASLGIVGESGCGKSVTALAIRRLIPDPPGKIAGGAIEFEGKNLLALSEHRWKRSGATKSP